MILRLLLTHAAVWLGLFVLYQMVAYHSLLLFVILCGYGFFIWMRWLCAYHPYWAFFIISVIRGLMGK